MSPPTAEVAVILTPDEQRSLSKCEAIVARGMKSFVLVGRALTKIRTRKLYRQTHPTFEGYCKERFGMSKTQANRIIQAALVAKNLAPRVSNCRPNDRPGGSRACRPTSNLRPPPI
jgi:hypothetical protein